MDRSKKKDDKQILYQIYRACRLCGAGGGYKMPIIQNFLQIDGEEIDLKQKIRECLQLEVNFDDRMPPLICELCVDKVTDFYEFLKVCRQTNKQTRMRLGLPLKVASKDSATDTCMLGLVEASSLKVEPEEPPLKKAKSIKINKDGKQIKQEPVKNPPKNIPTKEKLKSKDPKLIEKQKSIQDKSSKDIKVEKECKMESLVKDKGKTELTPKRTTRNSLEDLTSIKIQDLPKKPSPKAGPKSMLKELKELLAHAEEEPNPKLKRLRDKDTKDITPPTKKTKPDPKPDKTTPPKPTAKPISKPATVSKKVQPVQKVEKFQCPACSHSLKTTQGFANHMLHCHPVTWTSDNLACNACRVWFPTVEESIAHHKKHNNYKCLKCKKKFKNGVLYHQHIENKKCLPDIEVPDVKCIACWRLFATKNLLKDHKCLGPDGRPGGKCSKCNRNYTLLKNLQKHESMCSFSPSIRKIVEPVVDPEVKRSILPMEVLISKCDELLEYGPVVSACTVPHRYGLDPRRSYPYMSKLRVMKKPTFQRTPEQCSTENEAPDLGWEDFLNTRNENCVQKLSTMSLKVLFSEKMLGHKLVLENEDYQKRLSLKRKIDNIIFKLDDSNSCDSNSILDKNAETNFESLVSGMEKVGFNSDSTVFDEIASGFRSHDDVSSGNVMFDDVLASQNDDFGSKENNDDDTDSQNDCSESRNDDLGSRVNDLINCGDADSRIDNLGSKENDLDSNDDKTDSQNDNLSSVNNDLSSNDVEADSHIDYSESKNDDSICKDLSFNDSGNDKHKEIDNDQTDNVNDNENKLNNFNLEVNSDNSLSLENHENIVNNQVNQNTSTDDKIDSNNDQNNTIVSIDSKTYSGNLTTDIVNQTDAKIDVNNVNDIELEPNTRIINKTDDNDTNTINKTSPNNDENDKALLTDNETDTKLDVNNDKTDQNATNVEKTDIITSVNSEVDEFKKIESNNSNIDFSKNINTNDINEPNDGSNNIDTNNTLESVNNENNTINNTSKTIKVSENNDALNKIHDRLNKKSVNTSDVNSLNINHGTESINAENNNNGSRNDDNDSRTVDNDSVSDNINNDNDNNHDITNHDDKTLQNSTKNIDFSISSILNHDQTIENCNQINNTTKTMKPAQIDNSNDNKDTINDNLNNTNDNSNTTTENSQENDANHFPDNISLNEATDDSCSTKDNDIKNDRINDDSISLGSLKIDSSINVDKIDKFNVNDLSEDEKRLMAELDEQIGENNDKTDFDVLPENYDFN